MRLVKGNELLPSTQRAVLSSFTYRLTVENGYPKRNPCGARVPAISDAQWLKEHAFYVTKDGRLSRAHRHCEPHYMAEEVTQ